MFESLEISLKSQQNFARMAASQKNPSRSLASLTRTFISHLQFKIFLKKERGTLPKSSWAFRQAKRSKYIFLIKESDSHMRVEFSWGGSMDIYLKNLRWDNFLSEFLAKNYLLGDALKIILWILVSLLTRGLNLEDLGMNSFLWIFGLLLWERSQVSMMCWGPHLKACPLLSGRSPVCSHPCQELSSLSRECLDTSFCKCCLTRDASPDHLSKATLPCHHSTLPWSEDHSPPTPLLWSRCLLHHEPRRCTLTIERRNKHALTRKHGCMLCVFLQQLKCQTWEQ